MIRIDAAHYPETLGRMFLINVPIIFSVAWALIHPFLDERTQKKIEIISSEKAWKKRLRETIDPALLPEEYGGDCKVQVFPGSRTRKTHIGAGKKLHVHSALCPKGTTLRFRWFCRPGDISFSLHFCAGAPPQGAAGGSSSSSSAAPPPPGASEVYSRDSHPKSEKELVEVVATAAVEGYFVATWSNSQGWWARDVFHRYDEMIGGRAKAIGGLTSVTAAVGAGKAVEVISEVPRAAVVEEGGGQGGGGGGGGGGGAASAAAE